MWSLLILFGIVYHGFIGLYRVFCECIFVYFLFMGFRGWLIVE